MKGEQSGSVSGHQDLEITELTEMLEIVVLPEMSGAREQCIYRVPPKIRQANPKAYTPQVVSIGPFHNPRGSGGRDNVLESMEELKLKYLKGFLDRTELCVGDFILKLRQWESRIRSCYVGPINYNSNDFLKMILIDACFIIEHFLRYYRFIDWVEKDPLLIKPWLLNDIEHDLIMLENQLPFFLLEDIYNLAGMYIEFPSFLVLSFHYFCQYNQQNINLENLRPKHFTDLLRTSMLPSSFDFRTEGETGVIKHLYSASQLSEAGLDFQVSQQSKCLLDLEYQKGVLTIPCFYVHDTTETYMRNILAFEECHVLAKQYITQYLSILAFLINTEKDVNLLVDKKIIVNWMGDANAVVTMVKNLCPNTSTPFLNPNYLILCHGLNRFYETPSNKLRAILFHQYSIAAGLLLLLSLIQTICSIISAIKG